MSIILFCSFFKVVWYDTGFFILSNGKLISVTRFKLHQMLFEKIPWLHLFSYPLPLRRALNHVMTKWCGLQKAIVVIVESGFQKSFWCSGQSKRWRNPPFNQSSWSWMECCCKEQMLGLCAAAWLLALIMAEQRLLISPCPLGCVWAHTDAACSTRTTAGPKLMDAVTLNRFAANIIAQWSESFYGIVFGEVLLYVSQV